MTKAVCGVIVDQRIAKLLELESARERDSFASLDDLPALCSAQLQAI